MKIGFIVPALTHEAALLTECVANIISVIEIMPGTQAIIVIALQGDEMVPHLPSGTGLVETVVLQLDRFGVATARNGALSRLEGQVDAIMFTDVAVRPTAAFMNAASSMLSQTPVVSAPVIFSNKPPLRNLPAAVTMIAFRRLVFRGFIWSTLFRADIVQGLRFCEAMGPGTSSAHQAGEDSRMLMAIWRRSGLRQAVWLANLPVARLPRADLREKQHRYAWGQGWLVGRYPLLPGLTCVDRLYFSGRAVLFLANSLRLALSPPGRTLAFRRLAALWAGLRNSDPQAPPVD